MKTLIILLVLSISVPVYADRWCQWSGTQGESCLSDSNGILYIDGRIPTKTESILNDYGYFRVVITQPTVGADQVKDQEVWGFAGNEISLTWTVRDLTATEIDQRDAEPMPLSEYYLWRALYVKGVITTQDIENNLPQELQGAYLARDRLENP